MKQKQAAVKRAQIKRVPMLRRLVVPKIISAFPLPFKPRTTERRG